MQNLVARADIERVPMQFVGPKLLTGLHNIVGFDTDPRFGALSPAHCHALLGTNRSAADYLDRHPIPLPQALNLCASLQADIPHDQLVERLKPGHSLLGIP